MHGHDHSDDHGHDHHHHHLDFDTPEMAAQTELEGEVLLGLVDQATAVLAEQCHRHAVDVRRIVDLGSGPGVGTCALAERFAGAHVIGVDGSSIMLQHASARAHRLGLADRVDTQLVEFPDGIENLDRADVAWISMALHHIGDEADGLRRMHRLLEPGGVLAIVERAGPTRILLDGAEPGRPGLWDRLDAAWDEWFAGMRATLPGHVASAAYPALLADAGFEMLDDRVLTLTLDAPLDDAARAFAHRILRGTPSQLAEHADPADLAALEPLIDEDRGTSILRRPDAALRASRHLYVARA